MKIALLCFPFFIWNSISAGTIEMPEVYDHIKNLIQKNLKRSIKFSISGWIGFGFVELFTFVLFHVIRVGNLLSVSSSFLIGVAMEYLINEFWTTREAGIHSGKITGIIKRLLKFEAINLGGTTLSILIQYALFTFFNLEPLLGNLIGSAISFPVNYYLQMKITWGIELS